MKYENPKLNNLKLYNKICLNSKGYYSTNGVRNSNFLFDRLNTFLKKHSHKILKDLIND